MAEEKRICVIGAGPSGCSTLYHFAKLQESGKPVPEEVVCYEKQSDWGGLWNYSWRTSTDEYGEAVHGSMYRYLWSNGPKECLELPDYTFEHHFGKPIPSFPPREVLFDYLTGRWKSANVKRFIKFAHAVKSVVFNKDTNDFTVIVKDLTNDVTLAPQRYTHVVVATGHYSVPQVPHFPGIERFPGRVMHSHDFRDACEFKGKRLLLIGASYSAEDIAMQCLKYGAQHIICSFRTQPMGFPWPKEIEERPLLQRIDGSSVHFRDGSCAEVDAIILCTGYLHSYPFLADELRLKSKNRMWPPHLYKGLLFTEGGNKKLFYVGSQDQYYTFSMFDQGGLWTVRVIMGEQDLPQDEAMKADARQWLEEEETLQGCHAEIAFQTRYVQDLCRENKVPDNLDVAQMFDDWEGHKMENIVAYRDRSFTSVFTGTQSPVHHTPWIKALDDSMETFLHQS